MLNALELDRVISLADYLDREDMELIYTPYYQAVPVVKKSFNSRHIEGLFSIEPLDLRNKRFEHIRRLFEMHEEYICGFTAKTRPVAVDEFVVEMLFPDYSFANAQRGCEPSELLLDCLHRNFNGPMVIDCIKYAREVLLDDWNDPEFYNILKAPCFLRNVAEIWNKDASWEEMVNEAYMQHYIARYD